jgi:hypothetical protein
MSYYCFHHAWRVVENRRYNGMERASTIVNTITRDFGWYQARPLFKELYTAFKVTLGVVTRRQLR